MRKFSLFTQQTFIAALIVFGLIVLPFKPAQADQVPQQGALPAAGGTDQSSDLVAEELEVDVPDRGHPAVGDGHILDVEDDFALPGVLRPGHGRVGNRNPLSEGAFM